MTKYIKTIFLVLIASQMFFSQISFAQNSYVKAGYSAKEKSIVLKWYAENNQFSEGVVIYRKDNADNNWTKITDAPLKRAAKMSDTDAKKLDTSTVIYNYILNSVPKDKTEYENWEFTLILKSLLDNKFAEYAVLGFSDNKIESGKKYSYRVSYIRSDAEVELGTSDEVSAEENLRVVNSSLTLSQSQNKILCNWTAEPDNFVAYNLYRGSSTGKVKLNKEPIYVFEMQANGKTSRPAFLFSDSLSEEGTYNYSYTGLDGFDNESPQSTSVTITVTAVTLPPRAVNVRYDGNNTLTLYWRASSTNNLKGFNIFRGEDAKGEFVQVNSSLISASDTAYTDNTAELNKKYFYYISSVNESMTNNSSVIAAMSSDYSIPLAPENLSAVSDSMMVSLSWNKSNSTNVIGYKIYRNTKGNENEFLLMTPLPLKETIYSDTLSKGVQNDFYYKVVAVNQKYMNSDYSQSVSVKLKDVLPPSTPLITDISIENNAVQISWVKQFESDLAGYKIYRSEDSLSGFTEISSLAKEQISFSDNTPAAGKTYYYKISSVDNSGNVSQLSEVSTAILDAPEIQAPQIKINLAHDKESNSVNVSWEAVQSSSPVTGYILMRKYNDEEYSFAVSSVLTDLKFNDAEIESPARYSYSVKIIFENGDVLTSSEQSIEIN